MTDRELMQQVYQYLTGESVRNKTTDKHIAELISEGLAQPEQEPVAYGYRDARGNIRPLNHYETKMDRIPLYTTPPQRKPLLASEIVTMYDESPTGDSDMIAFARAIERAHDIGGEK
jgi:hypothetical protein